MRLVKLFLIVFLVKIVVAQKETKKQNENSSGKPSSLVAPSGVDLFSLQMSAYKNALKYFDLQAASVALYQAIALKPERTDLLDSLAYLYFTGERYGQVYLLGDEILKKDGKRNDIREMLAVSKQALNMPREALEDYEKLYASTKELQYLYQVASLQYQLKRYGECIASLDAIISNPEADKKQINIKNQDGGSQNVPMKAAAYNVKGICALEVNQIEAAKNNFNEALKIFPEFVLARNNLNYANQLEKNTASNQPQNKPSSTPANQQKK
ncbi:MAG: hypothetical protein RMJ53_02660 [Chitinophagales bacterium]|nr:hypothetical protein [Chitinophagales bacterium]MDW8273112.1 hypothetical protein [Chitinophagales bacterium]